MLYHLEFIWDKIDTCIYTRVSVQRRIKKVLNIEKGIYIHNFRNVTKCIIKSREHIIKWYLISCGPYLVTPRMVNSRETFWVFTWWRHQMETFSALLAICAGNSPVSGEFPTQRPVTRSSDIFFDLRLYKRRSKQSWSWWFETLSCPLWRQFNA